jgi:hypothetical protein
MNEALAIQGSGNRSGNDVAPWSRRGTAIPVGRHSDHHTSKLKSGCHNDGIYRSICASCNATGNSRHKAKTSNKKEEAKNETKKTRMKLLIILLIGLGLALLTACQLPQATSALKAEHWNIMYSIGLPTHPTQDGDGIKVEMKEDKSELDYLILPHKEAIPAGGKIESKIKVEAAEDVVFDYLTETNNGGTTPASASLVIYNGMDGEFSRWWSNPAKLEIKAGRSASFWNSFAPEKWSSVNGKFGNESELAKRAFTDVLKNHIGIGLTFGGGYFAGHGFRVRSGDAVIRIQSFKVTQ